MSENKDIDSTVAKNELLITRYNKSLIASQKVAPVNLTTTDEQLERHGISPDKGGYNPYPATGACSFPYCSLAGVKSGVLDCYLLIILLSRY